MKNNKNLKLQNIYEETLSSVCKSNEKLNDFFICVAHNFRFGFNNAIVAYAQLPTSKVLLTYDQWQLYGRVPKKHSPKAYLFDNSQRDNQSHTIAYAYENTVIDKRVHNARTLNFFNYNNTANVVDAIKQVYAINDNSTELSDLLFKLVRKDIDNMVSEGTHDTECTFYSKIITNMLLSRFSEKPKYTDILNDDSITPTDLQSAYNIIIDIFRTEYTILASELPKLVSSQVEVEVNQTTEAEVEVIPDKPSNEDNNFINKPIKISDTLTQSDIESVVCIGSGFRDGKFRIYDYFNEKHTSKEKSDFLKKEYGSGGCTYITPSNKHLWVQSSDKGINITYNNDAENSINIKYSELSKLISELIKNNRYLNKKELSEYLYYVAEEKGLEFHDDDTPIFEYKIGTTVYIGSAEYIVTNLTDDEVTVSQATTPLFSDKYTRTDFEEILYANLYANRQIIEISKKPAKILEASPIGDFYEIYGSQAEIASKILDLTLLTRNGESMVGFPAYTFDEYNDILRKSGYEISIKLKLVEPIVDEYFLFKPETESIDWIRYKSGQIVQSSIPLASAIEAVQSDSLPSMKKMLAHKSEKDIFYDIDDASDYTNFIEESPSENICLNKTPFVDIKESVIEYANALKLHKNPDVIIEFSEHPALYNIVDRKERFSFVFANELLGSLDMLENSKRENKDIGHYYKTDFKISYSLDSIHVKTYSGRYDLADGEQGIIGHIANHKDYLYNFENVSDDVYKEFEILLDYLQYQADNKPLNDTELNQINEIVNKNYGLDIDEETVVTQTQPTEEEKESLIGKVIDYADSRFRIKSVGMFNQVSLEDISSSAKGLIPIGTVLPLEEVKQYLNAQTPLSTEDYVITDNMIGVGTPSVRYDNNISAIKLLNSLLSEERIATTNEQAVLSKYVGWGGLANCFENTNAKNAELKALLSPIDYESASQSTLTAFYTPPIVIKAMYKAISQMGFTNGSILDPACGTGHFFGLLPEEMRKSSKLYGVELDNISGQIAKQLYPSANIAIQGFENTTIPDNFIDVAVGNVPFGDFKVFDKDYNKYHLRIHDYFFIKTLDKVRPNGIVAFITSKGTLDKANSKVRKQIAEKAELLGAIRLPNNTFKKAAGTDVTSDIIFLQKRTEPLALNEYPDWVNTEVNSDGIEMNSYFVRHPEMICGHMEMTTTQYGLDSVCIEDEGTSLQDRLLEAITHIKGEYKPYTFDTEDVSDCIIADERARNYSYFYDNETDCIYYRENGIMTLQSFTGTREERIKAMIELVDVTRNLINAEVENYSDDIVEELRMNLNTIYDKFDNKFGPINNRANSIFKDDNSYTLLLSLENVINDEDKSKPIVEKADIFTQRTITPHIEIVSAESPEEALIYSMSQRGKVDLEYMSSLTGNTVDELIEALNGNSIFLKPYEAEYATADEYLSGNVREKLKIAYVASQADSKYEVNVKALEAVIPKDIPASGISVHLGTTWIPVEYFNQFMAETFNLNGYMKTIISIEFSEYTGTYYIKNKQSDYSSVEAYNRYGLKERNGYHILEDCLNLKSSKVFDQVSDINGNIKNVVNRELTVLAQSKQDLLKAKFDEWIFKDPERRRTLTRIYNDKFNCIVNRKYDGSTLTFSGINPNIKLRKHQVDAIARMLYGGNTLLAHQVGAGKTFEMIAGAMKLKELGLVHKSLIVVPKHLTGQTGAEFLKLYPSANILVANEKDFTPQNRKRFCTRIATGNYDAIIIGHTQFDKIPLKPETQREILQAQLDEIMDCISEAQYNNKARATTKSLEKSKKSIENKLKELESRSSKDDVISFEELGVDQIFIDEAHYFKNLYLYTKMNNVAGIGSGSESGRASDLYSKICYLNRLNSGRGIVFATGTPISNTMSEMFTMQRYLQPEVLHSMGLHNFDAWATTFGETVTSLELAPEGTGYRAKTRFAKFNNIPELMSMFREVADVQTSETLKLPVPEAERFIEEVPPTELQTELIIKLGERADAIRNNKVDPSEDNMLKITNDGRCIALDPRVYNPTAHHGNKVSACAENIYKIWCQSNDKTQIVFCDLSTPPIGKKSKSDKYCVYDDLKLELVNRGIPADEIQFIQHHQSATAKEKLFSNVRLGKVRVIVGSTSMMGTGTNIQTKLVALHHLDCPYRPADIEQREGRIIRQGNTNEKVQIYNYVTKGTFDAFMYQMVERKQKFISSIMTAKHISDRSVDDIDEATLNYGQIKAVASDNPLVMRKFEIDSAVSKLTTIRDNYINEHHRLEDEVEIELPKAIKKLEILCEKYSEDIAFAQAHPMDSEEFQIEIRGIVYDNRSKALDAIAECKKDIKDNELLEIGSFRGFKLYLYEERCMSMKNLCMTAKHTLGYRIDLELMKGVGNLIRLNNTINHDIPEKLNSTQKELNALRKRLESAKEEIKHEFPQEEEYQALLKEQASINAQLTIADDNPTEDSTEPTETSENLNSNNPKIRR